MSGFPARAATLNVVGKHRRRQATAAARSSIGGSPQRRVTRHHPENHYGLATCRQPVPRSSPRRPDKRGSVGAQRTEALRPAGVLCWIACAALLINTLLPAAVCIGLFDASRGPAGLRQNIPSSQAIEASVPHPTLPSVPVSFRQPAP